MQKHNYKITINNFSYICRACLVENEELESIYEVFVQDEQKTEQLDLATIFKRYSNVEVSPNDNKPQNICKTCIISLYQSYSFFEKCSWSNQVLDRILCDDLAVTKLDTKDEIKIESIFLEEIKEDSTSSYKETLNRDKVCKSKGEPLLDIDNSKNKPRSKRLSKEEKTYFSDSETECDPFGGNEDDSDWKPLIAEAKNDLKVKVHCKPEKDINKELVREDATNEDLEAKKQVTKKRKIQEPTQPAKKRGSGRKNQSVNPKKDNLVAFTSQNKVLKCRICDEVLPDSYTAVEHYNKQHGTKYLKECLKFEKTETTELKELVEESDAKPAITPSLNTQLSRKVLTKTQFDGAFTCLLCHKKLGEIDSVIEHYEQDHKQDPQCIVCLRTYISKPVPLFHLGLHSKKSHLCRPCRLFFRSKEDYDKHNSNHDDNNSLACRICGKKFKFKYKKNKHMLSHLKEKNYSCYKCGKSFTYETSLARHFQLHNEKKRFLCSSCGNVYTTNDALQIHIRLKHTDVDADVKKREIPRKLSKRSEPVNVQCEFCGEIFKTKSGHGRHIRRHSEFREFKCKICSFMCDTREQLDIHMENNHNKYTCDVCGKRFPYESELKTHYGKHEDMKMAKFRCEVCGKTARTQWHLRIHLRIHSGERPFSCEICNKSFKQPNHLKVHMFQHTGKRPFKCEICEKTFPYQQVMEIHMRTHTGEKPFQCVFCGNAYHDRSTMQKHQKKKHPEMPIEKVSTSNYKITKIM